MTKTESDTTYSKTIRSAGTLLVVLGLAISLLGTVIAADANPAYTSAEAAGYDFKIQGEYAGVVQSDGSRWGVQVIALGNGTFRAVGYPGGLPGDGWLRGGERRRAEGKLEDKVAVLRGDEAVLRVDGKQMEIKSLEGELYGTLEKVERKSPTLGKAAPQDAIVLFDGTDTDQWNNAKLTEDKYLAATNAETKKKLGDHSLHIEFRTPFMPKSSGQARGNSGVYVQSRYEVQVLDSFGLKGRDNECGGIYSISEPKLNMCLPPLSWQTYDIDFTAAEYDDDGQKTENARITVRHNGVVIHDDLELPHGTPGRFKEGPGPAPLFLQDHSNPVVFRNIWVTGEVQ